MGLKKRSKVSAEFSMSSLTDIIFLLLIFFMLTSSLVVPNALNLKLPSSSPSKAVSKSNLTDVSIRKSGNIYVDGRKKSDSELDSAMRALAKKKGKSATISISPDKGTGVEHVVKVMDIALRYKINTILTPEK